jgi:hypothetical protein
MRQHQGRNLHNCGIGQGHCDVAGASTAAGSAGAGPSVMNPGTGAGRDVSRCKVRVFTTTGSWKASTRVPVQLGRGPDEPPDSDLRAFYGRLLGGVADRSCKAATGACANARAGPTTTTLSASSLLGAGRARTRHLVVVNLSPVRAKGRVRLP